MSFTPDEKTAWRLGQWEAKMWTKFLGYPMQYTTNGKFARDYKGKVYQVRQDGWRHVGNQSIEEQEYVAA